MNPPLETQASMFCYLFILRNCVREFSIEFFMNYDYDTLSLSLQKKQWQDICHSGGNWKLQSTYFHAFTHVW